MSLLSLLESSNNFTENKYSFFTKNIEKIRKEKEKEKEKSNELFIFKSDEEMKYYESFQKNQMTGKKYCGEISVESNDQKSTKDWWEIIYLFCLVLNVMNFKMKTNEKNLHPNINIHLNFSDIHVI